MAATVPSRRPKLSLQISAQPSTAFQSTQSQPKLALSLPTKRSSFSDSDLSESEEDAKFWSGGEVSSASSEDEEVMANYHSKPAISGETLMLPSPTCTSPFLPPASGMKFPTSSLRPGMTKLRIVTPVPLVSSAPSPVIGQNKRQQLSLSIPSLPRRLGVLPSPISPITTAPAPMRKSCLSSLHKPRKSVAFSSQPDTIISTSKYTLANSDLLEYLSSEECSEEELEEKWGMSLEEGRMLGMPRNAVDRRERKWIGLTNSFVRKVVKDDEE